MNAFLAGIGGAFALFPAGQLDAYTVRKSVSDRVYANFARVGQLLDASMHKAKDEQKDRRTR